MIIGFDFDNTLVEYETAFFDVARSLDLIPNQPFLSKIEIRNYLRSKNNDEAFTKLQSYVYGEKISEILPKPNLISFLLNLKRKDHKFLIISHKTKYPYKGPKFNLRRAALNWLKKNHFFENENFGLKKNNIYFEDTLENKIQRVKQSKCDWFFDDLPEVLCQVNQTTNCCLYDPNNLHYDTNKFLKINNWADAYTIIND